MLKNPPAKFGDFIHSVTIISLSHLTITIVSNTYVTAHNCLHIGLAGSIFIVKGKGFDCGFWIATGDTHAVGLYGLE